MKNQMKLRNNRLITLQEFLHLDSEKNSIKPEQWIRALGGHVPSIKYIIEHCKRDVDVLVEAYLLLRPLITEHPNKAMLDGRGACGKCGADKLQKRGVHLTRTRSYQRFQCQSCGSWMKGTTPLKRATVNNS